MIVEEVRGGDFTGKIQNWKGTEGIRSDTCGKKA